MIENKHMNTKLIFLITTCFFAFSLQAQKPFKELGLDHEVNYITLSDGRYVEYVENDTLRQIGSVMFNTQTNKVAYIIPEEELEKIKIARRDKEVSRFMSVDPLTGKYPWNSPYAFSENIVIHGVEIEGLEHYFFMPVIDAKNNSMELKIATYQDASNTTILFGLATIDANVGSGNYIYGSDNKWHILPPEMAGTSITIGENGEHLSLLETMDRINAWEAISDDAYEASLNVTALQDFIGSEFGLAISLLAANISILKASQTAWKVSTSQVNNTFKSKGWKSPYKAGTTTVERITSKNSNFVRVHRANNMEGDWIMRRKDISGLTPAEIKDLYSLKYTPTHISDVSVGSGSKLRSGIAADIEGFGTGGGYQFEILEGQNVQYTNTKKL